MALETKNRIIQGVCRICAIICLLLYFISDFSNGILSIRLYDVLIFLIVGLVASKQDLKEMLVDNILLAMIIISQIALLFVGAFLGKITFVGGMTDIFYTFILILLFAISPKLMGTADVFFNTSSFLFFFVISMNYESAIELLLVSLIISCIIHYIYRKLIKAEKKQKCPYIPALFIGDMIVTCGLSLINLL